MAWRYAHQCVIMRDDRVFSETRWLAILIVPFLVVAFVILYLNTSETKARFAWEIKAPMSAMMLGSAYIGGAYFFGRAALVSRWHRIGLGFLPITVFASFMAVATLIHWDVFSHGKAAFYVWTALYFATPFVVLAAWWRNRLTDPGMPEEQDYLLPDVIRYAVAAAGLANLVICAGLFVRPGEMIDIWPWALTPLTARVGAAMFALQGVFAVGLAADPRWSSARITL